MTSMRMDTTPEERRHYAPLITLAALACIASAATAALALERSKSGPPTLVPESTLDGGVSVQGLAQRPGASEKTTGDGPLAEPPVLPSPLAPLPAGMATADSDVPAHPLLPDALSGLDDELLASPMLHHPPFAREVERWVERWREGFSRWMPTYLSRMTAFEPMVDDALRERDLPWSLRYLPVIESGYSPSAVSSAEAVGLWQFMSATASDFGIEVGPLVDDRRDPFVSTEAAADYLLRLRSDFDSWFLALAAYNAGPDRINGLIERYLPDEERSDAVYWALRNVLPEETRNFVPNLLGAIIVASDPGAYGYEVPEPTAFDFDEVVVRGVIDFATAAQAARTTREEIARLNPEYVRGRTPPGRQVELRLPPGTETAFRSYFSSSGPGSGSGSDR
jgi:membrane-bound lytic murein transglycosylase D